MISQLMSYVKEIFHHKCLYNGNNMQFFKQMIFLKGVQHKCWFLMTRVRPEQQTKPNIGCVWDAETQSEFWNPGGKVLCPQPV